jgi:hypothetical protein
MAKNEIHISDVKAFKACRRRWNWASPLRRNLEPDIPYMPFFTGRAIHHCLEMYYRNGTDLLQSLGLFLNNERKLMGNLWPLEEAKVSEQIDLIVAMLQHYKQWVDGMQVEGTMWADNNLEFIALETEFSVPIRTPNGRASSKVFLAGRMDGVVRHKIDGSIWIWEIKTTRSIKELLRSLDNDPQTGAYIYAAQQLFGVKPRGVLYNIMRKKAPTKPEVLKNGLLTKRANIDTTAQAYAAAVNEHHSDWSKETKMEYYGDIIQKLADEGNTFFGRFPIRRTENEIDQLAYDLWQVSLEMTRPTTPIYPTESWTNCNFCPFRSPCLTMNNGGDVEYLLDNEYKRRVKAVSFRELEEEGND